MEQVYCNTCKKNATKVGCFKANCEAKMRYNYAEHQKKQKQAEKETEELMLLITATKIN